MFCTVFHYSNRNTLNFRNENHIAKIKNVARVSKCSKVYCYKFAYIFISFSKNPMQAKKKKLAKMSLMSKSGYFARSCLMNKGSRLLTQQFQRKNNKMCLVIIFKTMLPQNFSDYLVLKVNPTYNVEAVHLTN